MISCISYKRSSWFVLGALVCSWIAAAPSTGADAADPAASIAPFVNNFTFGVIRLDVPGSDFDALGRWTDQMLEKLSFTDDQRKQATQALHEALAQLRTSADAFTKAGGKTLWLVLSIEQFPRSPGFIVVPLGPGADADALRKLFAERLPNHSDMVLQQHGTLVIAMEPSTVEGVKRIQPQPRPELTKALTAAGDGRIQIALVPSEDSRRVFESMLPALPGGEPATTLTRGVIWAAASIQLPPTLSAHALVQSQDAASAQKLRDLLGQLKKSDAGNPPAQATTRVLLGAAIDALNGAQVKGDQLTLDLDRGQATNVAADLDGLLRKARERASRMSSINNIKQLILGCYMFGEKHNDQWPASLDELAKSPELAGTPQLFTNPRNPTRKPGYVYVSLNKVTQVKEPSTRIVLYEAYDNWNGGIGVGFADGHVQFEQDEVEFKKELAAQEGK